MVVTSVTVVTVVRKITQPLKKKSSTFAKSNLTHLTTNVMFSGQHFAILAMFSSVGFFRREIFLVSFLHPLFIVFRADHLLRAEPGLDITFRRRLLIFLQSIFVGSSEP